MSETARREQTIGTLTGMQLAPVTSANDLLGEWEMRFGGPAGSDRVQWQYNFRPDGSVDVGDEQWRWKFNDDGSLILQVPAPPDSATPGLEDGADSEEVMYPYRAADGRVVLANDDTSLIEVLTKVQ